MSRAVAASSAASASSGSDVREQKHLSLGEVKSSQSIGFRMVVCCLCIDLT